MFENVEWTAPKFWLDLVSTVAVFAFFVWTAIKQKQKDNSLDIESLEQSQQDLKTRVQALENTQALMATHEDVAEIRSQISGLAQKLDAANHLLNVLHEYTLKNKE